MLLRVMYKFEFQTSNGRPLLLTYSPHYYAKWVNNQWAGVLNFIQSGLDLNLNIVYSWQAKGRGEGIFREVLYLIDDTKLFHFRDSKIWILNNLLIFFSWNTILQNDFCLKQPRLQIMWKNWKDVYQPSTGTSPAI